MIFLVAYFLLGLALPLLLPSFLLFSCAADWMLPFGSWMVYSNEWALLGALLGLAARHAFLKRVPAPPENLLLAMLPPCVVILAHAFWPGPVGASFKDLLRALEFMAGLILPAWLLEGRSLRLTLWAFAAFALLAEVYGIAQHLAGPDSSFNAGHLTEVFGGSSSGGFQAASSFFQHHNQFGAFLAASTPPLALLLNPFMALPALAALFASYSRGALLGLAFGFCALLPLYSKKWRLGAAGALLLLVLGISAVPTLRHREVSMFQPSQNQDRVLIWSQGLAIWDGDWIWGRGAGTIKAELPARIDALPLPPEDKMMYKAHLHNQWLQWGVEYGILGILAWVLFFGALFLGALQSARWASGKQRLSGIALAVCILALAVQQSSDLLMLHARGLQIALFWGLCLAGMKAGAWNEKR